MKDTIPEGKEGEMSQKGERRRIITREEPPGQVWWLAAVVRRTVPPIAARVQVVARIKQAASSAGRGFAPTGHSLTRQTVGVQRATIRCASPGGAAP